MICFRLSKVHLSLFFAFRGIGFLFIIRFVFDESLHGVLADIAEDQICLFENIFFNLWYRRRCFADRCPILSLEHCMGHAPETVYWVHIQCLRGWRCWSWKLQCWLIYATWIFIHPFQPIKFSWVRQAFVQALQLFAHALLWHGVG